MVPVTYLFVVLFGERTWANEFAFAAWPHSARSTIELEGTTWASRYVLLCEWGESATKFTMNMSIKTPCFRSKTPTESSCRQSRPDQSSSASRGFVHVHVPAYMWVNFGSFAKACHGKSFYSGFLLFLEQQRAHKFYSLTKNQERTTLPSFGFRQVLSKAHHTLFPDRESSTPWRWPWFYGFFSPRSRRFRYSRGGIDGWLWSPGWSSVQMRSAPDLLLLSTFFFFFFFGDTAELARPRCRFGDPLAWQGQQGQRLHFHRSGLRLCWGDHFRCH